MRSVSADGLGYGGGGGLVADKDAHSIRVVNGQVRDDEDTLQIRNSSFDTEDFAEGVRSFLEKRPPRFEWS